MSNMILDYNEIVGASYVGAPVDNTMMYATKKIESTLMNRIGHKGCLVFVEDTINVPKEIEENNYFVEAKNPQLAYAKYAIGFFIIT